MDLHGTLIGAMLLDDGVEAVAFYKEVFQGAGWA